MANMSGISIEKMSIDTTIAGLKESDSKIRAGLQAICDMVAKKMEGWAKENAPWTDRTANARQGLKGVGYWEDKNALTCAVMHQVEYGVWLEMAMSRRFAILERSIDEYREPLMKAYRQIVGDL